MEVCCCAVWAIKQQLQRVQSPRSIPPSVTAVPTGIAKLEDFEGLLVKNIVGVADLKR